MLGFNLAEVVTILGWALFITFNNSHIDLLMLMTGLLRCCCRDFGTIDRRHILMLRFSIHWYSAIAPVLLTGWAWEKVYLWEAHLRDRAWQFHTISFFHALKVLGLWQPTHISGLLVWFLRGLFKLIVWLHTQVELFSIAFS